MLGGSGDLVCRSVIDFSIITPLRTPLRVRVSRVGLRVWGVSGLRFRVQGLGFWGLGFRD